jgi:ketosteroid isomerase-like protein
VIQRHLLRCRVASGEEVVIPACIFVTVQRGKITRIDEYLDTAQSNALGAAIQRARSAAKG